MLIVLSHIVLRQFVTQQEVTHTPSPSKIPIPRALDPNGANTPLAGYMVPLSPPCSEIGQVVGDGEGGRQEGQGKWGQGVHSRPTSSRISAEASPNSLTARQV